MAISIPEKHDAYNPNDIRVGEAEIKSQTIRGQVQWELPGGVVTTSKQYAQGYAERLNKLIQVNKKRFNRSLLWS